MRSWKVVLLLSAYAVISLALLLGLLLAAQAFGASTGTTTVLAALGGALVGSLGAVFTSMVASVEKQRETDERICDEASRVALDLTRMDYELRQQAMQAGQSQEFLAPAKVYREFYLAVVELRTEGTWPRKIEEQGLLSTFSVARPDGDARGVGREAKHV